MPPDWLCCGDIGVPDCLPPRGESLDPVAVINGVEAMLSNGTGLRGVRCWQRGSRQWRAPAGTPETRSGTSNDRREPSSTPRGVPERVALPLLRIQLPDAGRLAIDERVEEPSGLCGHSDCLVSRSLRQVVCCFDRSSLAQYPRTIRFAAFVVTAMRRSLSFRDSTG